jgi:D-amino-acid oxidase
VTFRRAVFRHILDASTSPDITKILGSKPDIIINATGLGSFSLGGVSDKLLTPARGQIVVVRNEAPGMIDVSGTDDGEKEACYLMTRAAGGGTILGGCYQKGNWDSQVDPSLAVRIMKRCVDACPGMVAKGKGVEGLDVVRHGVGLRPVREGGARVEKERVGGVWVVHNYGHGGAGYQSSFGCALEAVGLVEEVLGMGEGRGKAKL